MFEASALSTVFFAHPTVDAILRIDKPSLRNILICAQFSIEITHPILLGWATFRPLVLGYFSTAANSHARMAEKEK
ncbi:hypothetical protein ACRQF6_05890 [Actinotignum sp. GS-2025f]|uniref:hypothetical protein n=1 Tax=unclassified Actinotignum TaxID=2632702 RepID=UPI002A829F36|nr:hypothetical protein [Actinotignum sp. SLA_B059]MDY5128256.1 hypothetical protein [Actinotignum sp. SLA_B059]